MSATHAFVAMRFRERSATASTTDYSRTVARRLTWGDSPDARTGICQLRLLPTYLPRM